ncbi:MAG: hypothetical protein C0P72_007190 [Clostridia bacterium]
MPKVKSIVIETLETQLKSIEAMLQKKQEKLAQLEQEKANFLEEIENKIAEVNNDIVRLQVEKQEIEGAINILLAQAPEIPDTIPPEAEPPA